MGSEFAYATKTAIQKLHTEFRFKVLTCQILLNLKSINNHIKTPALV